MGETEETVDLILYNVQIRKKNADEKLQLLNKLLVGIKSGLETITHKLYAGDVVSVPATRNSMEQLSVAEDKLSKVMARLLGVDVFAKKMEMDEERFVPEGLGYKTDLFEEEEKVRAARKCLRSMSLSRKRKTLRADLRRRRFLLAAISKDNPISFWTPRAEARGEGERDDLFCILGYFVHYFCCCPTISSLVCIKCTCMQLCEVLSVYFIATFILKQIIMRFLHLLIAFDPVKYLPAFKYERKSIVKLNIMNKQRRRRPNTEISI